MMSELLKRKEPVTKTAARELRGRIPRLSSFGISSQEEKCGKCGQSIPPNEQHLKTYDGEYSQKVVSRRCMKCVMSRMTVGEKPDTAKFAPAAPAPAKAEPARPPLVMPRDTLKQVPTRKPKAPAKEKKLAKQPKPAKAAKPTKAVKHDSDDGGDIKSILGKFK